MFGGNPVFVRNLTCETPILTLLGEQLDSYNRNRLEQIAIERKAIANQEAAVEEAKKRKLAAAEEKQRGAERRKAADELPEAHHIDLSTTPASVLESTSQLVGSLHVETESNKAHVTRHVLLWRHPKLTTGDFVMLFYESKDATKPLDVAFLRQVPYPC